MGSTSRAQYPDWRGDDRKPGNSRGQDAELVRQTAQVLDKAQAEVQSAHPTAKIPRGFTHEECKLAQHICGVLTPFKLATRQMEDNREYGFSSCYLPTWLGLSRALGGRIPKPAGAGDWGSEATTSKYLPPDEIHDLAKRLRRWLVKDMELQLQKHLGDDTEAVKVLRGFFLRSPT